MGSAILGDIARIQIVRVCDGRDSAADVAPDSVGSTNSQLDSYQNFYDDPSSGGFVQDVG